MSVIDTLLRGSIDMHVHFGPDSLSERRQDALALARSARDAGLRAIVLKNREYMTAPMAQMVSQLVPEVAVFGSLTLDNSVGGLNPAAVPVAARMGAKIVWMPTLTSANSKARAEQALGIKLLGQGQAILDSRGKVLPQVKEILQIVKEFDIVLASGHLTPREIFALVAEAKSVGLSKLVITHALQAHLIEAALTDDQIKELAQSGAYIEHSFWGLLPAVAEVAPQRIVESVRATGAERCIMSSDLGQDYGPPAPEGIRMFIATLLKNGLTEKEVETMVKTNPARLIGLL